MEAVSFADMPVIASLNFFAEEMNGGICDLKYCRVLSTPVSPGMLCIKANPENIQLQQRPVPFSKDVRLKALVLLNKQH